jgi:hypothetical protein
VPISDRVNAPVAARAELGLIEVSAGTGLSTMTVSALDVPPPHAESTRFERFGLSC